MSTFKDQLILNSQITLEILAKMEIKEYTSGKPILPGDIVLHGILHIPKSKSVTTTQVRFKEDEIDVLYKIKDEQMFIPTITLIK